MGRKNTVPFTFFNDVDISTDQTSDPTQIQYLDNAGILVEWTGATPIGELFVQVSNDAISEPANDRAPVNWYALDFGSDVLITGNSGNHIINMNQLPFTWMRLFFDATSGTGNLTAKLLVKQIGG